MINNSRHRPWFGVDLKGLEPVKHSLKFAAIVAVVLPLSACGPDAGQNETVGTLLGAIAGGLAGAEVGDGDPLAVGIGTLLGAMVGGEVGRTLDDVDRQMMAQTTEQALNESPKGTETTWENPDNGHAGTFIPLNTTQPEPGIYCREFQQTVTIGGEVQEAFGQACRQPDGTWEIQQGDG
jgi:surface antigen